MTARLRFEERSRERVLEIRRARRLGRRQIETLRDFEAPHKFRPNHAKEPWQIMKPLVAQGLLWVEWRELRAWDATTGQWNFRFHEWWAGLTVEGRAALAYSRTL